MFAARGPVIWHYEYAIIAIRDHMAVWLRSAAAKTRPSITKAIGTSIEIFEKKNVTIVCDVSTLAGLFDDQYSRRHQYLANRQVIDRRARSLGPDGIAANLRQRTGYAPVDHPS